VEDQETNDNSDKSVNVNVDTNIESGTYYFSSAQEPSENTSVYGLSDKFALAMFQRSAPILLAYGGTYAHLKEMSVENILGKLDNIHAFVRLNSICHAHFCLVSGVRPSL
jgi:hypothetical protein